MSCVWPCSSKTRLESAHCSGRYASRLTGLLDLRSADHVSTSIFSSSCNNSMLCREARTRLALNTQVQDTVSGRGVFSNVPSSMPRTATWRMMGLVWPVIQIIQLISLAMLGSNLIQTLWVIQPKNPSCALCIHFFISSTCPENTCRCADIRTWSSHCSVQQQHLVAMDADAAGVNCVAPCTAGVQPQPRRSAPFGPCPLGFDFDVERPLRVFRGTDAIGSGAFALGRAPKSRGLRRWCRQSPDWSPGSSAPWWFSDAGGKGSRRRSGNPRSLVQSLPDSALLFGPKCLASSGALFSMQRAQWFGDCSARSSMGRLLGPAAAWPLGAFLRFCFEHFVMFFLCLEAFSWSVFFAVCNFLAAWGPIVTWERESRLEAADVRSLLRRLLRDSADNSTTPSPMTLRAVLHRCFGLKFNLALQGIEETFLKFIGMTRYYKLSWILSNNKWVKALFMALALSGRKRRSMMKYHGCISFGRVW